MVQIAREGARGLRNSYQIQKQLLRAGGGMNSCKRDGEIEGGGALDRGRGDVRRHFISWRHLNHGDAFKDYLKLFSTLRDEP